MDVLGTIAGAIDLASKFVSYIQAVKGAKGDRLALLSEVSALGALLEILRRRLDRTNIDGNNDGIAELLMAGIRGPLHQCYEGLRSIAEELERIASHKNIGKLSNIRDMMKNVTWPFRQEDIKTMLDKMEYLKSLILLGLQTSAMEFIDKTRDELKSLGLNVKGIEDAALAIEEAQRAHMKETRSLRNSLCDLVIKFQDSANSIANIEDKIGIISRNQRDQMMKGDQMLTIIKENVYNQELQDLIKWLSPLDFSEKHRTIFEKCARDTGEWFLRSSKLLAWRRGDSGYKTLWCPGHAGVGKSVMASLIVNELGKDIPENTALVFIYFEYKTKYTVSQLAEVILKQLMQQHIAQSNLKSLREHKTAGKRPTSEELFDVLKIEVETYGRVFVVIDALDETDIEIWTPLLTHLQALPKISLLATSRDTGEIELGLRPYQRLNITVNEGDLKKYIEGRLKSSAKLKRLLGGHTSVYEEIVNGIIEKADGMFLLAQLHVNSLEAKTSVAGLRRALDELPNTLNATYDEAMSRISNDDKALAYQIISWLVHAAQPMTIRDLRYALAVEDGMTALDVDGLHDEASLTSICVGLVVLREDTMLNDKVVGLVHYTAQEYFLNSPDVSTQFADSPHFAVVCFWYLAFDIFKVDGPLDEDARGQLMEQLMETPFAEYAMFSWGVHARAHCDDKTVRHLAMELLHDSQRVATVGSLPCGAQDISATHLCTHFKLKDYLGCLLDNGYDVNSKDSNGNTVVSYAAMDGHEEIIRLLLARDGVDINPRDLNGLTPLLAAVHRGHEGIVRLLLARNDLDLNSCNNLGNTAIINAAWRGYDGIVKLLLAQNGVDINSKNWDGLTALSATARQGHEGIAQLLLAKNHLDVNLRDSFGNTPIIDAARNGHTGIMELLLARDGVDINSRGRDGDTPLSVAVWNRHKGVAELLLARTDLDVNPRDSFGVTPIIRAVQAGNTGIVELLLARSGADINLQGLNGTTPISTAIAHGHDEIIQLLFARNDLDVNFPRDGSGNAPIVEAAQNGRDTIVELLLNRDDVDINSQGWNGTTSLSIAAYYGHERVAQLLLVRDDLNVNLCNSFGDTPIFDAAQNGHTGTVKLLLARDGVDINSQNQSGTTPLSIAARRGHEEVVQLLLAGNDLDVNLRDHFGDTPITYAAQEGHNGIVELLLARDDVDINSQARNGTTPLSIAAYHGHKGIMQLLLGRNDLNVNPRDSFGDTPIIDAAQNGHTGTVELLLARNGVDINSQSQNGATPLSVAAHHGHERVVQLLLERSDLDVNPRNRFGDTPIIKAAWNGHGGIVGLLLARDGMDINLQSQNGSTPLSAAACQGHEGIVQLLLARSNLDLNPRDSSGNTPIIYAAQNGHIGTAKLLLARGGVDINLQGQNGSTSLSVAIMRGHDEIVQRLLARADLDTSWRDGEGKTYLAVAMRHDNEKAAEWLLAKATVELKTESEGYEQESGRG